jgi:oligosaccharide repeat unit polymerase
MMVYGVILLLVVLSTFSFIKTRSLISPIFITPTVWAILISLFILTPHDLYPLQHQFLISVSLWNIAFFTAGLTVDSTLLSNVKLKINRISIPVRNTYFYLTIICTPIIFVLLYRAALNGPSPYFFLNLRSINTGAEEISLWGLGYVFNIAFIILLIELLESHIDKIFNIRVVILLILNIVLAILTVGRTSFLYLFIGMVVCLYFKGIFRIRHLFWVVIFISGLFAILTVARSFDESLATEDLFAHASKIYLFSGMPAFDTLNTIESNYFGANTFRFMYAVAESAGVNVPVNDTIYGYAEVPYLTNVYTVMYPFFMDFGYKGVFCGGFFYGLLFQFFYKISLGANKVGIIFYSFLFTALLLQFFGEYIFTNFSNTLQFLIIIFIPYVFAKEK